jgi:MFS superfamily sulfate permease-like transporter
MGFAVSFAFVLVIVMADIVIGVTISIACSGLSCATSPCSAPTVKEIADTMDKDREQNGKRCCNCTELDVFNLLFAKSCKDGVLWKSEF